MDINIDMEKLKCRVQETVDDIVEYPDREENLRDLHITITNDCELLEMITVEQAKELLKPIDEAVKKYNLFLARMDE